MDHKDAVERAKSDRRHFQRVDLNLSGRLFLPGDNREAPCQIVDLSPGGAQIICETVPPPGTQVVLYVDSFGRFEGAVTRPENGVFSVQFHCSPAKREKIAEQLTIYLNRGLVDDSIGRRSVPTKNFTRFTRVNGDIIPCEVLDLSLVAVVLKTDTRPPVGEIVLIGHTAGRVVRHHESGVALEFLAPHGEKAGAPVNPFAAVR